MSVCERVDRITLSFKMADSGKRAFSKIQQNVCESMEDKLTNESKLTHKTTLKRSLTHKTTLKRSLQKHGAVVISGGSKAATKKRPHV